ncbi:GSCOCG00001649001-RA-CDS [Cotesia congregata]|nr:GSCOCG00001649001-RA-CDS [Cotesia congregata]
MKPEVVGFVTPEFKFVDDDVTGESVDIDLCVVSDGEGVGVETDLAVEVAIDVDIRIVTAVDIDGVCIFLLTAVMEADTDTGARIFLFTFTGGAVLVIAAVIACLGQLSGRSGSDSLVKISSSLGSFLISSSRNNHSGRSSGLSVTGDE